MGVINFPTRLSYKNWSHPVSRGDVTKLGLGARTVRGAVVPRGCFRSIRELDLGSSPEAWNEES